MRHVISRTPKLARNKEVKINLTKKKMFNYESLHKKKKSQEKEAEAAVRRCSSK